MQGIELSRRTVLNKVKPFRHLKWSLKFLKLYSLRMRQTEGRAKQSIQFASYNQTTKWGYKAVPSTFFLIRRQKLYYIEETCLKTKVIDEYDNFGSVYDNY